MLIITSSNTPSRSSRNRNRRRRQHPTHHQQQGRRVLRLNSRQCQERQQKQQVLRQHLGWRMRLGQLLQLQQRAQGVEQMGRLGCQQQHQLGWKLLVV